MPNLMPYAFNYLTSIGRNAPQPGPIDPMQARMNALTLSEKERQMAERPEERNWLLEKRGMERKQFDQASEDRIRKIATEGFKSKKDVMDFLTGIAPMVNRGNWDSWKKIATDAGMPAETLPDASSFGSEEEFEAWVENSLKNAKTVLAEEKPVVVTPGATLIKGGKAVYTAPTKPEKETIPNELRQFEMETGTSETERGTKKYQDDINKWRAGKKEAIQITSPFEQGKYASSLRKEFEDLRPVKDYRDLVAKFGVMKEAYKESLSTKNFVATDQALITLFNKMTDPQSVVRESEYARTPSDLALMNRLKGKIEKLSKGGPGLTQEDRKALITMGEKFFDTYTDIYKNELRRYRGYARMAGLDPDYVAEEFKVPYGKSTKPSGARPPLSSFEGK